MKTKDTSIGKMKRPLVVTVTLLLLFHFNIGITSTPSEAENPIFTLFTMGPFDTVLSTTLPSEGNTSGTVRAWGVPGQNVQATFSLHANQDLHNVSIIPNDFVSGSNVISADCIDVRVVKVWNQSGRDRFMESPVLVPELLVYDDTINLSGGWELTGDYFPPGYSDNGYYANGDGELCFENPDFFDPIAGTMDFWVKPDWNGTNNSHHRWFVNMEDKSNGFFRIHSNDNGYFYAVYNDPVGWEACYKNDDDLFTKGEWTRITFTWNTTSNFLALYFNGIQVDTNSNSIVPIGRGMMYIGGTDLGLSAESVIDNMRFYNYSASPGDVASSNFNQNYLTKNITFDSRQDLINDGGDLHRIEYKKPKISTEMNTEIPQDTTKQFWFKIRLSEDVMPGIYRTNFTVITGNTDSVNIPVELELLPFTLKQSPKIHSVFLSMKHNTTYLPYDLLEVYLDDMIDHGINGLWVNSWDLSEVNRTFDLLKAKGLMNSVMYGPTDNTTFPQIIDRMTDRGFLPYFYGVDEPNQSPEIEQHIRKSHNIHETGGLVAVGILKQTSDDLDDPTSDIYDLEDPDNPGLTFRDQGITNEKLDWADYHATCLEWENIGVDGPLMDYIMSLRSGGQKIDKVETYYWQPWVQKYKWNRNMAGFFLWGSHLNGSWPWGFSLTPDYYGQRDPFNDFDNQNTAYRDFQTVYPSEDGPIPTLQWEAMAEGVIDVRYLATLEDLIMQLELIDPQRADDIRVWINTTTAPYMTPNQSETMSGKQFDDTRWAIAMKILELQSELHPQIITDVTAIPDPQEIYEVVNISTNVKDKSQIFGVSVEIYDPDLNFIGNFSMLYDPVNGRYYWNQSYDILGTYTFTLWANDTSDHWNSYSDSFVIQTTMILKQGWNLVSVPLIQTDQNLINVLESIDGLYDAVQWYDAADPSDPWKIHVVDKPFGNDLSEINEAMGFWIHITQPGDTIFVHNGSQPATSQQITLQPGWNLVGYPSLTGYSRTEGLNNLAFDSEVGAIWSYNTETQTWEEMGEVDSFEKGKGYWVHATDNMVWDVPL